MHKYRQLWKWRTGWEAAAREKRETKRKILRAWRRAAREEEEEREDGKDGRGREGRGGGKEEERSGG